MRKKTLKELAFPEPLKGKELIFELAPVEKMEVVKFQRKPSNFHILRLASSIEKVGFLVPLVGVKRNGKFLILDGQHRLLAAQKLGIKELPIILVPEEIIQLMMNLNIEKELNIREKSYVALKVYEDFLGKNSQFKESDAIISEAIEPIYFVTLGIGYEKKENLRGKIFENILKKCDLVLDETIKTAFEIRKKRAEKILLANEMITEIAQKLKETEKWHPFVYQQIISYANPIKKKREFQDFDEVFDKLFVNLKKVKQNPGVILKEKGIEETEE